MAWESGFFNSVNGDRVYKADHISGLFEGLITDGVYESIGNKLAVQANSGMTIQIASGRGFFSGRWVNNDAEFLLTLEDADVLLKRYCAVCVKVDLTTEGRTAQPYLKYGALASEPIKPTMERTDTVKEYCLAYILINGGVTEITNADIEDARFDTNVCGWVTGLIEQIDANTIYQQQVAILDAFLAQQEKTIEEWVESLTSYLDANAEAKIAADILNLQNREVKVSATFDGLGWDSQEDGTYTQTLTVEGITANNRILVLPTEQYIEAWLNMGVEPIAQDINSITFTATAPENINMVVDVIIYNL